MTLPAVVHRNEAVCAQFLSKMKSLVLFVLGDSTKGDSKEYWSVEDRLYPFTPSNTFKEMFEGLLRMNTSVEKSLLAECHGSSVKRVEEGIFRVEQALIQIATEVVAFIRGQAAHEFDSRIQIINLNAPKTSGVYGMRLKHELVLFRKAVASDVLYVDKAVSLFNSLDDCITAIEEKAESEKVQIAVAKVAATLAPPPAKRAKSRKGVARQQSKSKDAAEKSDSKKNTNRERKLAAAYA
jgi:hypothetical protein